MSPNPSPAAYTSEALPSHLAYHQHAGPTVSWAAIFAGLSAALALEVLFMMLGAGLGFAIYSPITSDNPISNLGTGAAVIQGISAVISLWFGGWIAGRFTPSGVRATGWLHGFSVWATATVVGVLLVSSGAGWALGDLSKLVGGGLSLAGKPAAALASGATDVAKDALKQSGDTLTSFTDEAVGNRPAGGAQNVSIRAKREVGMAVARLFNPAQQGNMAENRAAVVKALVDHTGMSAADANRTVTDWTASYERMKADLAAAKAEAEIKAREAGDKAATALAIFSFCYFVGFLIGALAASWGGHQGVKHARRCETSADVAC
ncbi:MAG: hypothetical protein H7343_04925 [Undibacterium sp.]|nr:hypothetical protein [Opitutaceae bacterium]